MTDLFHKRKLQSIFRAWNEARREVNVDSLLDSLARVRARGPFWVQG